MPRVAKLQRLSQTAIIKAKAPCILNDGGGLRLVISSPTACKWVFRYTFQGRAKDLGLGAYPIVGLQDARDAAEFMRRQLREGKDPLMERSVQRGKQTTFREAFDSYWEHKKKTLSNGKHIGQWTSTMENYVFPKIGDRSVAEITAQEIVAVFQPMWHEIPETASRTLQRVRAVFETAILLGWRQNADPCTGITRILGPANKNVQHHPSLNYTDTSNFVVRLRASRSEPMTKLALEFLILTAARSGEIRLAPANEIDPKAALWTIRAERMKARREHVVPLSARALEIYKEARKITGEAEPLLFPNVYRRPYSDMVFAKMMRDWGIGGKVTAHGFRATFKTWCAEVDKVRDEVSEVALAHVDKNKVREAYKRALYLEERRTLMQRWADYVLAPPAQKNALAQDGSDTPEKKAA